MRELVIDSRIAVAFRAAELMPVPDQFHTLRIEWTGKQALVHLKTNLLVLGSSLDFSPLDFSIGLHSTGLQYPLGSIQSRLHRTSATWLVGGLVTNVLVLNFRF